MAIETAKTAKVFGIDPKVAMLSFSTNYRYGGHWRFPKMLDYCYLVNPYFPTARMKDELRANFDTLLTEYPSGMFVNSLLAGKYFGIRQQYVDGALPQRLVVLDFVVDLTESNVVVHQCTETIGIHGNFYIVHN